MCVPVALPRVANTIAKMKTSIALFGAGGKMGFRAAERLSTHPDFELRSVEVGASGLARLKSLGLQAMPEADAVRDADVAALALPDHILGEVSNRIAPLMKPGSMIMTLDSAAARAGDIQMRPDLAYFIGHPCHPPLINDEVGDARMDFFGGIAKQHIVCALIQGDERHYALGEKISRVFWNPVMNAYRVSMEQMAILEPALVETTIMTCLSTIREAIEVAVSAGVPREAAWEFAMGHVNVGVGVLFGYSGGVFSDGAHRAIAYGKSQILQAGWKKVFDEADVLKQVRAITHPTV
jgi:hypothetical protein